MFEQISVTTFHFSSGYHFTRKFQKQHLFCSQCGLKWIGYKEGNISAGGCPICNNPPANIILRFGNKEI